MPDRPATSAIALAGAPQPARLCRLVASRRQAVAEIGCNCARAIPWPAALSTLIKE
jgi:hypothetical protein